jgi:hypothetical protein
LTPGTTSDLHDAPEEIGEQLGALLRLSEDHEARAEAEDEGKDREVDLIVSHRLNFGWRCQYG